MEADGNILRKCKLVIEELQDDLTRKTLDSHQKDSLIHKITLERNHLNNKNEELQRLVLDMKDANVLLRAQIKKNQAADLLESEVARLQKEMAELVGHLQSKQILVNSLESRLELQGKNQKSMDRELDVAMGEINTKIKALEAELRARQLENQQLQTKFNSKKCECCEAVTQMKDLSSLRKKIQQSLKTNSKACNQNIFQTVSTKKSFSVSKESASNKKSPGGIINNLKSNKNTYLDSNKKNIKIPPFILTDRSNIQTELITQTLQINRAYINNRDVVTQTLRQIEDKLSRMSQKLAESQESDMSVLSLS